MYCDICGKELGEDDEAIVDDLAGLVICEDCVEPNPIAHLIPCGPPDDERQVA